MNRLWRTPQHSGFCLIVPPKRVFSRTFHILPKVSAFVRIQTNLIEQMKVKGMRIL